MPYLLSFFGVLGLIIGVIYSKYVALVLIFFSNIFFTAYSDAKLLAHLGYLALLLLATYFYKRKIRIQKWQDSLLHFLLFVLAVASIFSYVYISKSAHINLSGVSTFIYNDGQDSTAGPFHIHTLKPIFTWALTLFGVKQVPYYGSGLAFFQGFPELKLFYISCFFILLVSVFIFIHRGIYLAERHGVFFLFVYSIFSFGVLKALVDGGPLWYEFYLNYALLAILLSHFKQNKIWLFIGGGLIVNYGGLVVLRSLISLTFSWELFATRPIVQYALFFTGLGLILFAYDRKKYIFTALLCLIFGLVFYIYSPAITPYLVYCFEKITPQDNVIIFSQKPLQLPLMAKEGSLYEYRYSAKNIQSIFSVLLRYGHFMYYDVEVEGKTCDAHKKITQSTYVYVREGKLLSPPYAASPFFSFFTIEPAAKLHTYWVTYQYRSCMNDSIYALQNHLKQLGLYSFMLYR